MGGEELGKVSCPFSFDTLQCLDLCQFVFQYTVSHTLLEFLDPSNSKELCWLIKQSHLMLTLGHEKRDQICYTCHTLREFLFHILNLVFLICEALGHVQCHATTFLQYSCYRCIVSLLHCNE